MTATAARIDPFAPGFMADPYPAYRELLAAAAPQRVAFGLWAVARFEQVSAVLRDRRFGHDYAGNMLARHGARIFDEAGPRAVRHWMLVLNPPEHTRVRELMAGAFGPRQLEALRPRVDALVERLLDRVAPRGAMDLMHDFAAPLPALVICEMLGIPEDERAPFLEDARIPVRLVDVTPVPRAERDQANADVEFLSAYFDELCARRRHAPQDDLTTALVRAEGEGLLSREELIANLILLFGAGQDTTSHFIGNAFLALQRHPAELARLRADLTLLPGAVEELLRFDPSVQVALRHVLEDAEVGGVPLRRGEGVIAFLAAANRDPAVHPDPDRLDLGRRGVRVLSFGGGLHHCLGAHLARLEAAAALRALLTRLPGLRLDESRPLAWRRTFTVRGPERLPVLWDA